MKPWQLVFHNRTDGPYHPWRFLSLELSFIRVCVFLMWHGLYVHASVNWIKINNVNNGRVENSSAQPRGKQCPWISINYNPFFLVYNSLSRNAMAIDSFGLLAWHMNDVCLCVFTCQMTIFALLRCHCLPLAHNTQQVIHTTLHTSTKIIWCDRFSYW